MTHPTCPTGTQTICVPTCLTVRRTSKGTFCTKIPRLASCKNQNEGIEKQNDQTFTKSKFKIIVYLFNENIYLFNFFSII